MKIELSLWNTILNDFNCRKPCIFKSVRLDISFFIFTYFPSRNMKMPLHSIQCQSWPIFAVSTCCFKLAFLFAHQQLKQRLLAPSRSSVFFFSIRNVKSRPLPRWLMLLLLCYGLWGIFTTSYIFIFPQELQTYSWPSTPKFQDSKAQSNWKSRK